mmetsp:Transcript_3118/g.10790  ORF Transcript_3118/g.10790 Transcript_3118/m.10790 type:complete len:187 (+) Transcript_3118:1295-1855(+)
MTCQTRWRWWTPRSSSPTRRPDAVIVHKDLLDRVLEAMDLAGQESSIKLILVVRSGAAEGVGALEHAKHQTSWAKSIATGVRVVKQNCGSQGEGIWVCKVKEGQEGEVTGSTLLDLQEAVDNHKEEKTLDDFMTFCEQYIVGENGQLIDQRFLPRIVEGELRVNMPAEGGISATVKSGALDEMERT